MRRQADHFLLVVRKLGVSIAAAVLPKMFAELEVRAKKTDHYCKHCHPNCVMVPDYDPIPDHT